MQRQVGAHGIIDFPIDALPATSFVLAIQVDLAPI
jgi:hypothetical protein